MEKSTMKVFGKNYRASWMIERHGRGIVRVINQPLLPHRFVIKDLRTHGDTAEAIRDMTIRGAGTIGAVAAFGLAQGCLEAPDDDRGFWRYVRRVYETLVTTRPTANDLKHNLDRVMARIEALPPAKAKRVAVDEARGISDWYAAVGERIARNGLKLVKNGARVLTHCNAGWLALQEWGSAPAPVYLAHRMGRKVFVWVDETRPRCQGANLTSWELTQEGVPHAIIPDNAAGFYLRRGEVDVVITGADRIAGNGDTANKIGTYEKAVLARENGVPFYIAAPTSTFDPRCKSGDDIPIEERSGDEVLFIAGRGDDGKFRRVKIAPAGAVARNPAFDVTPARYITGIITERGIVRPTREAIRKLLR
jgi:S-methyl-5-thioribose-1-phosphate isomerase